MSSRLPHRGVQWRGVPWRAFRARDERGSVAMEAVILVPALVLLMCTFVAGWRLWSARTQMTDAASAAARAATLETSAGAARSRAEAVAGTNLDALGVPCEGRQLMVDSSGFATPPGTPAQVRVEISCRVGLADLLVPGLPGSWQLHAVAAHQMDTFRERRP